MAKTTLPRPPASAMGQLQSLEVTWYLRKLVGFFSLRERRWAVFGLAAVIVIAGAKLLPPAWAFVKQVAGITPPAWAAGEDDQTGLTNRITLLLIGVGSHSYTGPTDSILLASFDPKANTATVLSIPRDTYAHLEGRGWDKINHAYSLAPADQRAEATVQAVSELLALPIEHYAVINMQGFKDAVDLLGGVDIYVEKDMFYVDPYSTPPTHIDLKEGQQRLDGLQALDYTRFRHDREGDFGRMRRQQQMLTALLREALSIRHVPKIQQMVDAFNDHLDTNLNPAKMLKLALAGRKLTPEDVTDITLTGSNRMLGGVFYLELDLVAARTAAYQLLYGNEPDPTFLAQAEADAAKIRALIRARLARDQQLAEQAAAAAGSGEDEPGEKGDTAAAPDGTTAEDAAIVDDVTLDDEVNAGAAAGSGDLTGEGGTDTGADGSAGEGHDGDEDGEADEGNEGQATDGGANLGGNGGAGGEHADMETGGGRDQAGGVGQEDTAGEDA